MLCDESWIPDPPDKHVIQCNYSVSTSAVSKWSRAYVVMLNPGGGNDRIVVLVRSRGSRFIEKWESSKRLANFRVTTMPHQHPMYHNDRIYAYQDVYEVAGMLQELELRLGHTAS
jgi:hypothetical protein